MPSTSRRIPELDGLRGVAIVSVIVGHFFAAPGIGPFRYLDGFWVRLGWSGVDLFFVISGFLIGGILLDHRDSPDCLPAFYIRRSLRILPVYYGWIILYVLFILSDPSFIHRIGMMPLGPSAASFSVLSQCLFFQNFTALPAHSIGTVWFSVTWSLAVEEQFYLISPWLVRGLSRRALTILLGLVVLFTPLLRLYVRTHFVRGIWLAYSLMPCRADTLAIGMLAALLWRSKWLRRPGGLSLAWYAAVAVLFCGVAVIWRWYPDPRDLLTQTIGYSWLALFFAAVLLLALMRPREPVAWILRSRVLRRVGVVSYCMYITHVAVLFFCNELILHRIPAVTNAVTGLVSFLAIGMCYLLAMLSWKLLEYPLIRRGHRIAYSHSTPRQIGNKAVAA